MWGVKIQNVYSAYGLVLCQNSKDNTETQKSNEEWNNSSLSFLISGTILHHIHATIEEPPAPTRSVIRLVCSTLPLISRPPLWLCEWMGKVNTLTLAAHSLSMLKTTEAHVSCRLHHTLLTSLAIGPRALMQLSNTSANTLSQGYGGRRIIGCDKSRVCYSALPIPDQGGVHGMDWYNERKPASYESAGRNKNGRKDEHYTKEKQKGRWLLLG